MTTITETAQKTGQSLERALDAIFLAIGNAYYEANRSSTTGTTSGRPSPSALGAECNTRIKASRASFLDSLDQLDIMVLRATEVLQRCARQKEANLFDKTRGAGSIDAAPGTDAANLDGAGGDGGVAGSGEVKEQGPSPETMLLRGEGLLPPSNEGLPIPPPDCPTDLSMEVTSEGTVPIVPAEQQDTQGDTTKVDAVVPAAATGQADADGLVDANSGPKAHEEEMMDFDGPIDFGDMVFDFNLDDTTHFDFGAMIDAD
ncbi:protein of unknown function [Taphrina deformans PYCC 5710]|uniref:Uncharacterized protein n=1 Tax=Taphrina deformans (strain PYCC 5710 / ATCC 11124 / CBS 356.35 / IMI 108563 / JCM 9778 / NBRC 8474) TaxID=1097556 RepID=R4XCR6_TAPDE|nr:protein of unknown function [Taphrina deformans PYCC 5710]|eukprot:CCG81105.1 protein of unknown function [Taphrina deformans PYCC 5710]